MKEQEKKMLELVREIYKLAKEISPETTFLNVTMNERGEDYSFYNTIHINNNHWEIKTDKIEIREELQ